MPNEEWGLVGSRAFALLDGAFIIVMGVFSSGKHKDQLKKPSQKGHPSTVDG